MTHGKQYEAMWKSGQVPDVFAYFERHPALDQIDLADVVQTDQFLRWNSGRGIPLRDYLERCPRLADDSSLRRDLARHEAECRLDLGEAVSAEAIERQAVQGLRNGQSNGAASNGKKTPASDPKNAMSHDSPEATVIQNGSPKHAMPGESPADLALPHAAAPARHSSNGRAKSIGRYEILDEIGSGAFGIVYLAQDPLLNRRVAVKVPRPDRFTSERDVHLFLNEAQAAASLRHEGIVAVHDSGRTEHGPFVVMDYIEGETLESLLKADRPTPEFVAELSCEIALALAAIHEKGLVHRDLKPANVLIDRRGRPRISDFGMAVHESVKRMRRGEIAGTAYYMSPEQARGETHRLDGRTDLWALGVMMYEMLTGRRPFDASTPEQVFHEIEYADPIPPRMVDSRVPPELARITLKCLAKRMTDRYESATDLADELRLWASPPEQLRLAVPMSEWPADPEEPNDAMPLTRWIRPPGLRAFEERDSVFFHDLLPGPRDRNGMPESIRFWKQRIEQTDRDETFSVGLIYGPSGCGKSSLMKAGLLPCLESHVLTVRLDATPNDTEPRLLRALRKRCPSISPGASLVEAFAELRDGSGLAPGQKVLVVIDQFEQWLHAHRVLEPSELVEAFRQCDGGRLQAIVMIRDDFWMAATRFMRALEVRVVEGDNSAAVDLFDPVHAKKVLAAFARAFQRIPSDSDGAPIDEFLNRAVAGLTRDGRIVCVRLALFAEMVKGRPWTLATLNAVGGMDGVGVTFLEETFSAPTAPPIHKLHEHAARRVLRALLPEHGADIKGHLRTEGELRAASGYRNRPRDFEDLLQILDRELRLITPADPTGNEESSEGSPKNNARDEESARCYQLTHDYLVPSLREWLTRKQRATRRGRAELKLAERAAVWNSRPERRHLPTWWEHLTFAALTRRSDWNDPQRRMMRASAGFHLIRAVLLLAVAAFAGWMGSRIRDAGYRERSIAAAEHFVRNLSTADVAALPDRIADAVAQREFIEPRLRAAHAAAPAGSRERLRYAVILSRWDEMSREELFEAMLSADPDDFRVLHGALLDYGENHDDWVLRLLGEAHQFEGGVERRFRAVAALAPLDVARPVSDGLRWSEVAGPVTERLVRSDASELAGWRTLLRPARNQLREELARIVRIEYRKPQPEDRFLKSRFSDMRQTDASIQWTDKDRDVAAEILANFAARPQPLAESEEESAEYSDWLCELLTECDEPRFLKLFPALKDCGEQTRGALVAAFERSPDDASTFELERAARRHANAAIGLAMLGDDRPLWMALGKGQDERMRSWTIDRVARLGFDPQILVDRMVLRDDDPATRRAILLSLGLYPTSGTGSVSPEQRRQFAVSLKLKELVRSASDPGVRNAAVWLLRGWEGRGREDSGGHPLSGPMTPQGLQWLTSRQGKTFVVLPMEGRRVAFAAEEVVLDDFQEFFLTVIAEERRQGRWSNVAAPYEPPTMELHYDWQQSHPAMYVSWHLAARYCNWLSEREDIPESQWCYEFDGQNRMRPVANSLERAGFRLPTTKEWITACRGGSDPSLSRHYGDSDLLLANYAWYSLNTLEDGVCPVGSKMPNDWGLFDMLGNVFEWIDDAAPAGDAAIAELPPDVERQLPDKRPMMGGAFCIPARVVISTKVEGFSSQHADYRVGFRPVRTMEK